MRRAPARTGAYRYHSAPVSISSDDARRIGVMRDADGSMPTLDADGAHACATRVYHCHLVLQIRTTVGTAGMMQWFLSAGSDHGTAGTSVGSSWSPRPPQPHFRSTARGHPLRIPLGTGGTHAMATHQLARLAAIAALALAPLVAHADPTLLSESITVPLDWGCTFHATVRGAVSPSVALPGPPRWSADVRIASSVRCPGAPASPPEERAVLAVAVTREELEWMLGRNGSVAWPGGSAACGYEPDLAFDGVAVRALRVRYACAGRRGGGPPRFWHTRAYQQPLSDAERTHKSPRVATRA